MIVRSVLLSSICVVAIAASASAPLGAQTSPAATASPASTQIQGVTITAADIHQLLTALHTALQPNDDTIPIELSLKSAADMPSYDRDWHYDGIRSSSNGAKTMNVWINKDLRGGAAETALESAFLLAIVDGGYAGTAFKQLYDICATADSQLPANAPDPYLNRHKFAAALVHAINLPLPSPSP